MRSAVSGMLIVDKPAGPTSHDVVARVRKRLSVKAGHTGTLDPQATGVLLVCLGGATRLVRFLQHADKSYECTVRFGWETDTYDAEGEPVGEPVAVTEPSRERVTEVVAAFVGDVEQVPPVYSAKKIRGEPSYRRVRRGEEVEHEPVRVRIDAIEVLEVQADRVRLRVDCGPGTYVRTLAVDIGRKLGCPAHLHALRRTRVGRFGLERAVELDRIEALDREELQAMLVPPAEMLADWPGVVVDRVGVQALQHGSMVEPGFVLQRLPGSEGARLTGGPEGSWVRVLDRNGDLLAAAEARPGGVLQPRVVIAGAG